MNNLDYDPWDDIDLSPQDTIDIYKNKSNSDSDSDSSKDPWDELDFDEGFWKKAFRTVLQIPQGIAEGTIPGISAGLFQMLALGESDLNIDEWHKLRELADAEGIPFDEEAYENARQEMLGSIPTVSNIGRKIEQETGLPLEAKTGIQKLTRLGSLAGKFQPGSVSQKATAAAVAPATTAGLESLGVPEQFSELGGLGVGAIAGAKTPALDISLTKTKPSGLPARQFENTKKPTQVSEKKLGKINEKLETDFKDISDKIIKESPVGETFDNLKSDPTFKSESRELLNQAQEIADSTPGSVSSIDMKKEIAKRGDKRIQGYSASEYDKSYSKFMKESIDDISGKEITPSQLVKQYRKNNQALSEYFEPGSSKALNRAKRDSLLDHNRTIADVMDKHFPESELSNVFKEGNDRWTKIMDAEAVDDFVNELFKDGVNYKKMNDFFDKQGYEFKFKRALGDKGYNDFKGLVKDMLTSETPYKMLKVAKSKGYEDLFHTGLAYVLHPKLGAAKLGVDVAKNTFKGLMNSLLDKPQLSLKFKKGLDNLKKGNFVEAQKEMKALRGEIEIPEKVKSQKPEGETIDVKPDKISNTRQLEHKPAEKQKPTSFTTEKGSTYTLNEDGTTTRTKAYRREHGEKEQGIQPTSEKTWFVNKEDADKLGEIQTKGGGSKRIIEFPDGRLGVMYETGPNAGKVEARTVIKPEKGAKEGLIPVESWESGKKVHFGNKINKLEHKPVEKKLIENKVEPAKDETPKSNTFDSKKAQELYYTENESVKKIGTYPQENVDDRLNIAKLLDSVSGNKRPLIKEASEALESTLQMKEGQINQKHLNDLKKEMINYIKLPQRKSFSNIDKEARGFWLKEQDMEWELRESKLREKIKKFENGKKKSTPKIQLKNPSSKKEASKKNK